MARAHRIKGIDCNGVALAGIQKALTERFDEMFGLRSAALKWKDPEGVHSMRVASRRLRSAMSDFAPYVTKRTLAPSIKHIRNVAVALGGVRDQDVAILALEELAVQVPKDFSGTLNELIDGRKSVRKESRKILKDTITREHLSEVAEEFRRALTLVSQRKKVNGKYDFSYREMAQEVISDRLEELAQLSSSLYTPWEITKLHDMRIAAKRLRYAIELFEPCWTPDILLFSKGAARLQTALGKLHDCDVWIQSFGQGISESTKAKQQEQTKLFVWLFTHFNELRSAYFQESFSLWNSMEKELFSESLKQALSTHS